MNVCTGIRSAKDTDGINGGLAVLHVLGSRHGIVGNLRIKVAKTRWRAVGKEHNNLLGVRTARSFDVFLGLFHTIIGTRSASRSNGIDRFLKTLCAANRARRQPLHCLRVVVAMAAGAIRVVSNLIGLITRKLNNGNLMLPIHALDTLVLLGDGINKAVRSVLQRFDTLGLVASAHRIIHRARGIQHHHDVKRRGNRHG